MSRSLAEQARAVASGRTSSRALVEAALEAIAADPRPFTEVFADEARAAADALDRSGKPTSPIAGVPVSIKDLFDLEGRPTPAGSTILAKGPIAARDAPIVERLKAAGAIIVGRTHMSSFAFSGVGLNPHGPQPVNPADPDRAPGGSSSGAAVSVALGQVFGAIGTDTGGSVRIPAACCGVVGFKPTRRRVSRDGVVPLAPGLDSVGPLAASVEDCALLDAILADQHPESHPAMGVQGLRLGVVRDLVFDDMDEQVAADFERALGRLSEGGARIEAAPFAALDQVPEIETKGAVVNAEAYAVHEEHGWLAHRDQYDPNVLFRLEVGGRMTAADYLKARWRWDALAEEANRLSQGFDALVWPTCAIVAPKIAGLEDPKAFGRANSLLLRNARIVNLFDGCAISLPMHEAGALPTGLMLVGPTLGDARLLAVARTVETALHVASSDHERTPRVESRA
jgi:aspartyl-tRNA(Asn)/glutamyl-tRNA(Gln) amidotransferase subunit A